MKLTATHKRKLAEGRTMSATVDRYLVAVNTPKRRGRKVSKATLEARLAEARALVRSEVGVAKLLAAQDVRDLQARIAAIPAQSNVEVAKLEREFVRICAKFSENRGVTYGAWRDAGVPAIVLKKAKIARTRTPA